MRTTRIISLILLLALIIILVYTNTSAGENKNEVTYGITTLADSGGFTNLQERILRDLRTVLSDQGYGVRDNPEITIFFSSVQYEDNLIISTILLKSLPEPVIDWGKKEEVFYKVYDKSDDEKEKPDQGIRQYMSEEYLRQFGSVLDSFIMIESSNRIDELVHKVVDRVTSKRG